MGDVVCVHARMVPERIFYSNDEEVQGSVANVKREIDMGNDINSSLQRPNGQELNSTQAK